MLLLLFPFRIESGRKFFNIFTSLMTLLLSYLNLERSDILAWRNINREKLTSWGLNGPAMTLFVMIELDGLVPVAVVGNTNKVGCSFSSDKLWKVLYCSEVTTGGTTVTNENDLWLALVGVMAMRLVVTVFEAGSIFCSDLLGVLKLDIL